MATLDTGSLQGLKDNATSATNSLADMTGSAPGLLNQLKTNLTNIFATNNPFITERNTALETFLNTPSQTRANILTPNLPEVAGSRLTLSPTQQNAITTAARNAALVPLAGLNQIVTGLYGNVGSAVQNAGSLYDASIRAQQIRAEQARQQYQDAFTELEKKATLENDQRDFAEKVREFNVSQAKKTGTGDAGFSTALAALLAGQSQNNVNPAMFDEPDQPQQQQQQQNTDPLANLGIKSYQPQQLEPQGSMASGLFNWLSSHIGQPSDPAATPQYSLPSNFSINPNQLRIGG